MNTCLSLNMALACGSRAPSSSMAAALGAVAKVGWSVDAVATDEFTVVVASVGVIIKSRTSFIEVSSPRPHALDEWRGRVNALFEATIVLAEPLVISTVTWQTSQTSLSADAFMNMVDRFALDEEPPVPFLIGLEVILGPVSGVRTVGLMELMGIEIEALGKGEAALRMAGRVALRLARDVLKHGSIRKSTLVPAIMPSEQMMISPLAEGRLGPGPALLIEAVRLRPK
jgi:hypothetical protein